MTREEAIAYFKRHIELYCVEGVCREAEEMAITALQELCGKDINVSTTDAISRAEVLKKAVYTETEEGWSGYTVSVEDIKNLSSVQPKQKTGSWRKDIDNSRRWDRVRFYCSECGGWQTYGETDFCPSCGAKMKDGD